jgi:hypothetical protein
MKKMLFGSMLFIGGFIGLLTLVALSILKPWQYNDFTGLIGFLLGSNTLFIFVLFGIMLIKGLYICYFEAYKRRED